MRITRQDRLDDGRCREFGDVQNRTRAVDGGDRFAQDIIGQTCHNPDVRAVLSGQKRDFKVHFVIGPGADDGACAVHSRTGEVGGVVDPDDPRACAPQLLGDRLRQRVLTADDDFAVKLEAVPRVIRSGLRVTRHVYSDP